MNTRSIGQGMMVFACVLGLGVMTLFFAEVEERQFNPNQDPESIATGNAAEVRLQRNRAGHYVVTGRINGSAVDFLLDTGATDVVIPDPIARQLGLQRGRSGRAMTANGIVTIFETRLDTLSIGDITLYNVKASINPAMDASAILLGMSALKQVEFIQRGDTLTLRKSYPS